MFCCFVFCFVFFNYLKKYIFYIFIYIYLCVCVFYGSFFALFLCFFCLIFFLISYIVYYKCDCSCNGCTYTYFHFRCYLYHLQWNLRIKDNLGLGICPLFEGWSLLEVNQFFHLEELDLNINYIQVIVQ